MCYSRVYQYCTKPGQASMKVSTRQHGKGAVKRRKTEVASDGINNFELYKKLCDYVNEHVAAVFQVIVDALNLISSL